MAPERAVGVAVLVGIAQAQAPLERLLAAQDTGGAIRGVIRGDFYWGTGETAGEHAGRMRQQGRLWLLWPRGEPLPAAD